MLGYLITPTMQTIFIIIFSTIFFLCNAQNDPSVSNPSPKVNTTILFKKEIPTYANGSADLFYELVKQKEKQLKLDTLESGFESLQIRIWYDYDLRINRELLVLKYTNGKWKGEHFEMLVKWDADKNVETVTGSKINSVTPKSGWESFIHRLLDLKIMTLPNMDNIPGLVDNWTDGVNYNIEVATKKQYRFYGYHLPEKFEDRFWQAKNITEILALISTERMR